MTAMQENSLDLMIRHEEAVGHIYEHFAELFPDQRVFWEQMAREEEKHADCLRGFAAKESLKKWFQSNAALQRLAIQGSIDYVQTQRERAGKGGVGLVEALSIALDLEEALIEKQLARLYLTAPEEIKGALKNLVSDTYRHRKTIAEQIDFHRKSNR